MEENKNISYVIEYRDGYRMVRNHESEIEINLDGW
jgi:hypothetical protein